MRKQLLLTALTGCLLLCGCGESLPMTQDSAAPAGTETQQPTETAAPSEETTAPAADPGATSLESFTYEIRDDGTAVITKYKGKDKEVVVPSSIGEAAVTEIGQYAFEAAFSMERITLPEWLKTIGEQAFLDCDSLKDITIPEGVTSLPRAVFAGCTSLEQLILPASVTDTEEELLSGCALKDLYVMNPELTYANWGLEDMEEKCTIHAPEGAAILTWAEEHGFPVAAG